MQQIETLIKARWTVPVEPAGTVYEDHAVAVHEGRIVDILPAAEADARYTATVTHRLTDRVLIPGLVNNHTHAAMVLFRGLSDDLPLMEWLNQHIWPAERRWVSDEFVQDGVRLAAAEMLRTFNCGIGLVVVSPDEIQGAIKLGEVIEGNQEVIIN